MSALSLDDVSVICDISHLGIVALECRERVNEHASLHVKMAISQKALQWFDRHSLCDKQLGIQLGDEISDKMSGTIVSAQWGTVGVEHYVDIQALSVTKKMDRIKRRCFFQQMDMTYGDVLKKLSEPYHAVALISDDKGKKIEYPIVQYAETDWELTIRIASQLNTAIMVDSKAEFPKFSLGYVREKEYEIEVPLSTEKIFSREAQGYRITSWENLPLGAQIKIYGEILTVVDKMTTLKNSLIEFTYVLVRQFCDMRRKENENLRGGSVRGRVLEVQGERLKLDLGMDDEHKVEQLYAYWYLPVTGNAMYAMPEVGTEAELYIPVSDMKDAYIRNSFLAKTEYPDEAVKYMGTTHQKILEMTPDGASWETMSGRGQQNLRIKRTDGLTVKGSNKISLTARKDIIINAKTSCKLDAAGEIELAQTDTINSIHISGSLIQMSAECYEVSSDSPPGKRTQAVEMNFVMTKANQSMLAAIPMNTSDMLALQMAAAIPQILSADSFKNTGAGCLRRYWRG